MKLSMCIQYRYYFKNDGAPYKSIRLTVTMMMMMMMMMNAIQTLQ